MNKNNNKKQKKILKKQMSGKIVSLKMKDTAVVEVGRVFRHPLYKKILRRSRKFFAHYNDMDLELGDKVIIEECKPISKRKHFIVLQKV